MTTISQWAGACVQRSSLRPVAGCGNGRVGALLMGGRAAAARNFVSALGGCYYGWDLLLAPCTACLEVA